MGAEQRYSGKEGYVIIDVLSIEADKSTSFFIETPMGTCYVKPYEIPDYPIDKRPLLRKDLRGYHIETEADPDPGIWKTMIVECLRSTPKTEGEEIYTYIRRFVRDTKANHVGTTIIYEGNRPICFQLSIGEFGNDKTNTYWARESEKGTVFDPEDIFRGPDISTDKLRRFIDSGLPLAIPLDEVVKMGEALLDLSNRNAVLPSGQRLSEYSPDK